MVQTRHGADTSKDASKTQDLNNKENEPPAGTPPQQRNRAPATKTGSKRKPILEESAPKDASPKKQKTTGSKKVAKPTKENEEETNGSEDQEKIVPKPRLTTLDIEFDYDRSKLRDPRSTPGRNARPRYNSRDIPNDLKAQLEATREIPKPELPKTGRLTNAVKSELIRAEARMNPLGIFHDLYRCYDKGRDSSPTYDEAGFQLDYDKVAEWMKPQTYNKKRMMNSMDKSLQKKEQSQKEMFGLFFQNTEIEPHFRVEGAMKDQVSKDIGVPWHQIGPEQVRIWREKGFQPVNYDEWKNEPSEEDNKRASKMSMGCSMRKHL